MNFFLYSIVLVFFAVFGVSAWQQAWQPAWQPAWQMEPGVASQMRYPSNGGQFYRNRHYGAPTGLGW